MVAKTRGPLPPGVYWRRRLAVVSVLLVAFLGAGKMLDLGSDGSSDPKAEQVGSGTLASPTATVSAAGPSGKGGHGGKHNGGKHNGGKGGKGNGGSATPTATPTPTPPPTPVLPDPTGPCADDDVFITPSVAAPVG